MQNGLKSNEWRRIWVHRTFKIEIQKGGPNNSNILQNWFPLFNLSKFQDSEKSLPHSCRMDWNLMNDEEFGSIELLRLKYRRGDQIIQRFCKIGFLQKLDPPSLICINRKILRKVLLNHAEYIEFNERRRIWGHRTLGLNYRRGTR